MLLYLIFSLAFSLFTCIIWEIILSIYNTVGNWLHKRHGQRFRSTYFFFLSFFRWQCVCVLNCWWPVFSQNFSFCFLGFNFSIWLINLYTFYYLDITIYVYCKITIIALHALCKKSNWKSINFIFSLARFSTFVLSQYKKQYWQLWNDIRKMAFY